MDPSQTDYPPIKDLTAENLTENVKLINSGCQNPRMKFLAEKLVEHAHDFCRETRFSMDEYIKVIDFLTATGQKCTKTRQEFILLADVLGISMLVDSIDHPKPPGATEGTVLGPFHTDDAHSKSNGQDIDSDEDGIPLLVYCILKDTRGAPISGAKIDVWEVDSKGFYDTQYTERDGPHGRAVLQSDENGICWFKGNVPVSYPVPVDGPVGDLLRGLRRHPYRPAHMHFMINKDGYDELITALTIRGDPYESHDPVFGAKDSLILNISELDDHEIARKCNVELGMKLLRKDFILVTDQEATELRQEDAKRIMGKNIVFHQSMPVPASLESK